MYVYIYIFTYLYLQHVTVDVACPPCIDKLQVRQGDVLMAVDDVARRPFSFGTTAPRCFQNGVPQHLQKMAWHNLKVIKVVGFLCCDRQGLGTALAD